MGIMLQIFDTLVNHHDLRLVLLAAFICTLSAFACMSILVHARRAQAMMRPIWLAVAAISVGFGIWSTHFVAMLSFDVGFAAGYDVGLTLASLGIAIVVCGGGLWVAASGNRRSDKALGGAIVGLGISLMHYTGMAALQVGGVIDWDAGLVAGSMLSGIVLGGLALTLGTRPRSARSRWIGTGLLTLAICSMHFTAMGAAGFDNCYAIVSANELSPGALSLIVGMVSILILALALGGMVLDLRDRKRAALEASRMRGLADAAVEGLLVCNGRTIVTVNTSFLRMIGNPRADLAGRDVSEFIAPAATTALFEAADELVETELHAEDGSTIPVEIVLRTVDYGGSLHQALAIRDLRARKDAERHIRFLAHHDAMTGLANRASFNARLEEEIVHAGLHDQTFAVLCLDLDRFKEVNDLFGHATGDALLQKVANVMETSLSGDQFIARLGGDEFAVILPDIATPEQAGPQAQAILDAFARENAQTGDGTLISASIGISIFPDDTRDATQLMTFADTALYCAKEEGRGIYRFFEAQMGAQVRDRRQLEHDLRQAVLREQLSLVYQPQVDLATGAVSGFEALVRWTHPERGPVSPADFIPVAEDSGLVLQIGEWVIRTACQEAARWVNPLGIAVNVSAVQLHAPHFASFLHEVLVETGLAPQRLEIEITETALIRNMSRALATLRQIKALGIKIAMDDFGTGYSSLSNLRAFPFDKIKVDQSFIRAVHQNDQSATIVRAVLGLGKGLNLPVLAEGVERPEELEFLRNEVCDSAQGFWLGRPMDISAYDAIVHGRQSHIEVALDAPAIALKASA